MGGSEVHLRETIPAMARSGIHAEVAMPDLPGTAAFRAGLGERGVRVHAYRTLGEVPTGFDLTLLSSWHPRGYRKYYRELRPPFVSLVHDQLMLHLPGLPQALYRTAYDVLQAGDIRQAASVITVSHWAAEHLRRYHRVARVDAVPNGVDVEKFRPASPPERAALRTKLGFSRFTVLVPARLSLEKNHLSVLGVARGAPELDFVLVGSGPLEGLLRRAAPPNMRLLGQRQDMPELYRAADVVLQPTIAENQSLATLEALASGTGVVTNDIPPQRELIAFGQEGLLVAGGVPGYVQALRAVARHPERLREMGERARSRVLSGHTLAGHAEELARVLHRLAGELSTDPYRP